MRLGSDIRQAWRGMWRAPGTTAAAILCLGLGIGATTAIYSAVNAALLRPLPFPEPDRLVTIYRTTPHFNTGPFSPANFLDLRENVSGLAGIAAMTTRAMVLQWSDASTRVSANPASGDLFSLLGVRPLRGRLIQRADEAGDQPAVAVVSEELWRDRFGGAGDVVGRTIRLDGVEHEVIGVLPRGFRVPHGNQALRADVWVPLRISAEEATWRRNNYLMLIGRLRDGVAVENAHSELFATMAGIVEQYPELRGEQLRVLALHQEAVRTVRGPLLLLMGAVAFVLLIATANVASLLLARGVSRRTEFALRSVLGASRWRVLRPALVESALLAAVGGVVGIGLAWSGARLIRSLVPGRLPQLQDLAMDPAVLAFAISLAAGVSLLCGLAPAWQANRTDPQSALRDSGRTGKGRSHQTFLRHLVAVEVGLSLVLLIGAGLVLRGFGTLVGQDPGFDPQPLLTLEVNVPPDRYGGGETADRFLTPALEAIRRVPGVIDASAISLIPYTNWGWNFNIRYEGQPGGDPTQLPLVETRVASPTHFATFGMTLMRGRLLTEQDGPATAAVAVVNQALVDRDFPTTDPIGKRFHTGDTTFATIVGVVSDMKNMGPERPPHAQIYRSYRQANPGASSYPIVVRVNGDPANIAGQVSTAVLSVDPAAAISAVLPMEDVIAGSVARPRFYLVLLAVFAAVALVLALAGLYGVMSYVVAQRTREIGIRSALGSTPSQIIGLVMRQGLGLVAMGTFAGLLGAFGLTRLLTSLLFGVSPLDFMTWLLVTMLLASAAAAATLLPARRASSVAPLVAIRTE
jgi:predicted permease